MNAALHHDATPFTASPRGHLARRGTMSRMKKYQVILTQTDRAELDQQVSAGTAPARDLTHARILLKADSGPHGPAWNGEAIATALDTSLSTIARVRRRFAEGGLTAAVRRRPPRREYRRKLDGAQEARLIAEVCSSPPDGYSRWSLRLLADRIVELTDVDSLSYQTTRRVLKRNELKPWLRKQWVIPPKANADFVWRMEDVLEVYTRPYDPRFPQVCMDETEQATAGRPAHAAADAARPAGARRLRVRAERHRQPLPLLRAACRLGGGWP